MDDWITFKKSFSQSQEDALWQYFIDHAQVQKNGYLGIQLYLRNVDDFWRRVHARYTGEFQRYDKLEKKKKQEMAEYKFYTNWRWRVYKTAKEWAINGTWRQKLIVWAYDKLAKIIIRGK